MLVQSAIKLCIYILQYVKLLKASFGELITFYLEYAHHNMSFLYYFKP